GASGAACASFSSWNSTRLWWATECRFSITRNRGSRSSPIHFRTGDSGMSRASFVHAHAGHADWHVALAECQSQIKAQIAARAGQHAEPAPFTLGWCYLSDFYAPSAEEILAELRLRLPGVAWVGTVGVGVSAGGVEYIDEPALVLMIAPLARESFRLFSGLRPLPSASSGFVAHTALVHAEGSTPDLQELLEELSTRTATGYLFGGLASAR